MARIRELSVGYIIDSNLPFSTFKSTYLQELFRQLDSDLYAQIPWGRTSAKKEWRPQPALRGHDRDGVYSGTSRRLEASLQG
jgi:hypothetical protein